MDKKIKQTGRDIFQGKEKEISLNYLLLSEARQGKNYIAFSQSDSYQGKVLLGNNYKPILLTKFE